MFVETWFILLGEHGKAQPIYVIWVISNTKSRIFKTLKIGLCTKVATLRLGHLSFFGRFFPSFLELTFGGQLRPLVASFKGHLWTNTSQMSPLFGVPWMVKLKPRRCWRCWRRGSDGSAKWVVSFLGCWSVTKTQQRLWELMLKSLRCVKGYE